MHVSVSKDQWRQTILLVFPLAFAIVVTTYSWRVNTKLADDYAAVTRSYAITAGVDALMSRTTDGETAERGFVITGNETYLQPYFLFTSTIEDLYASLMALTANDPIQGVQVALLRPLLDARKEELARVILLRRETGKPKCRAGLSRSAWEWPLVCRRLAAIAQV
jgi:CHASE3 domain sensor protein